ncbi:GlcG/HbpS family heme-binding protein [Flavobacterium luteolum]|uniref:GlcG/HbpS family heme-binding protein n=1 Tax=Flavobacterium luteolum TaxID=3003259 RepID=UPI00248E5C98|nr:heme-binding protein [Flavobacterium luteolum]
MENDLLKLKIFLGLLGIENRISDYLEIPEDKKIANGNVAVCIIDNTGVVYGRMFGKDKSRMRNSFKVAWTKASQVWLTGVKTGDYEKMVFNNIVEENANGIEAPDLIGWKGGQPITLSDGTKLSVGFSGFTGESDLEIVSLAFKNI